MRSAPGTGLRRVALGLIAPGLAALALAGGAQAAPVDPDGGFWQPVEICPRGTGAPRDYAQCLAATIRTSEQALEAELANAVLVIATRADLSPAQRGRWKTLLEEAQSRFLLYRNFDCQSVAPFEGPRGIGNFEQRALCLIGANSRRAAELHARYTDAPLAVASGPQSPPRRGAAASADSAATAPQGPQPRRSVWIYAVPPTLD